MALSGGIVFEEVVDLSSDRLLMMMKSRQANANTKGLTLQPTMNLGLVFEV
jgi:hypothetical protein